MNIKTTELNSISSAMQTTVHPAFNLIRTERIESLNVAVEEYQHIKTGAMHYHISADNQENVFLVAFRTVPMDSTGVAHILEHTSLCGSKQYPVRDPFFMMIRRSLNTFMNAFTSSDWTAYPFASQNKKDFNNLMDVYLDAVFFTRLDELDFLQEGHRVEFSEPDNSDSDLEFKGVVFNEMKGAMSSPISVLWQTITKNLYPTSTYHYNSGGEPADIPDLTYAELKDFHKTHYHPSNAIFMTFGDIPAFEHQSKFEEQALIEFSRLDTTISVDGEKRFTNPIVIEEPYSCDVIDGESLTDKTHHVIGWLLGSSTSLEEMMQANFLSQVLFDNSSSPLRKALETTELGAAPSPLCGLEDSNYEMCFLCGLEGSRVEHADKFEKLVFNVLEDVANNGIPFENLEAVLHQLELSQREIGGDGYPYGLQLILEGLSAAIHRSDPVALMNLDPVIASMREQIKDPEFIKKLVRDLLINNKHRVRLTLRPDTELSQRIDAVERERLDSLKNSLSAEEIQTIIKKTKDLEQRQLQVDDPGVLPKVDLDDVPADISVPEPVDTTIAGSQSFIYKQGTNNLIYHEIVSQLPALDTSLLHLLPYYSACVTELGCGDKDYLQVQEWQSSVSGGIGGHASIRSFSDDVQKSRAYYLFSGKALDRNNIKLTELMYDTMFSVRFDETTRIREIISQNRVARERSITGNGHTLAMAAASAGMSPVAKLNHNFNGLEGIRTLKILDDNNNDDKKLSKLASQFNEIHQQIVTSPRQFMLTAEAEKIDSFVTEFESIWSAAESNTSTELFALDTVSEKIKQMWVTNTQVNFCSRAYPTVNMEHSDAAALSVLGGFMRNGFLHTAIREQGGAYGGGAGHDTNIGTFRFFSYRDPRLAETLNDFDKAIEWVTEGKHEWRQVEEAILGVISSLDKPGSPAGEARKAFHNQLHGRTIEKLSKFRQQVLAVTLDDLKQVTVKYLLSDNASTAVITNIATKEVTGDLGLQVINV